MSQSTLAPKPASLATLVLAALALVAGSCALWQIWEQDLFWQIRAGQFTALNGWPAQRELWSYTASNQPWIDIQWLANLGLYFIFHLTGETGLIFFRGLMTTALMTLMGLVVLRAPRQTENSLISALLILLPLLFCALAFRIQLRPDFLLMITTAGIIAIWEATNWKNETKAWSTLLLIFAGANLHAGTTPYVILIAYAYLVSRPLTRPVRVASLSLAPVLLLLTPSHWQIIPFILNAAHYSQGSLIANPDFMSIGSLHFNPQIMGWTGWAWLLLMALTIVGWWNRVRAATQLERATWTLVLILLTISGLRLDRTLPYQILFAFPLAVSGFNLLRSRFGRLEPSPVSITLGLALLGAMITSSGFGYSLFQWGFQLNPRVFPTGAAAFIRSHQPVGPIYHIPEYGNYMATYLPEYPVFADTRDLLYAENYQLMHDSYRRPDKTQELASKFGVNVFWMPSHRISLKKDNEFVDRVSEFYPPDQWALVDFDQISMVLVRKITEHQELIAQNEYRFLKPHLPPDHYLFSQTRNKADDQIFVSEIERCLVQHPDLPHCWAAKSAWVRAAGDKNEAPAIFARLEELLEAWPNHLALRMEILNYYRILERKDDVLETEKKIKELIYSPALRQ